ncbi:hypothetical protein B1A99_04920 [Cohnella sp. CIP 111063]|uniref:restriction endonuclease n=1 Tax=unclassified Cohnella TaxID=2636738 RepID=UPI000B8C354F|nr:MULTISPECIES: restriction endonuclease [unclassified Cohnella]OXS60880.1 hypothetical protein B1A99_04920 [Cohnella sp. CIP 111063]PRX73405.1 restriction endonuclease [Cohnella sp. SGD-V74]
MRFPNDTGLLLNIIDGVMKEEEMMIQCIDNYHYPFRDFVEKARSNHLIPVDDTENGVQTPRLYVTAGHKDKISYVEQAWRTKIQQAFEQYLQSERILRRVKNKVNEVDRYCLESMFWLYLSELMTTEAIYYPQMTKVRHEEQEELEVLVFYWSSNPNETLKAEVQQSLTFWLNNERLILKGYQCLTRPFILRNMIGRKVLGTFPDRQGNWGTLLEGGVFLPLSDNFEDDLSKLKSEHVGQWTAGEVEEILLNPVYAFGYYFNNIDLISEWIYVFLYALATMDDEDLATIDLGHLYCRYCEYLGKHICPFSLIKPRIIEVNLFVSGLKKRLIKIREYLKGEEEPGISKNILLMMRNRHAFLPTVNKFIRDISGLSVKNKTGSVMFDHVYWKTSLRQLKEEPQAFEKGKKLEELAQYFFRLIPGLKVVDVRSKRGRAEVDLYCCNISYDSWLWRLGALILIECKNRKTKVEVSDIRNLAPTMEAKGIHGAVIISRAGFTSVAIDEIKHQLFGGKIIVPISLNELEKVGDEEGGYHLLKTKLEEFDEILNGDDKQFYF